MVILSPWLCSGPRPADHHGHGLAVFFCLLMAVKANAHDFHSGANHSLPTGSSFALASENLWKLIRSARAATPRICVIDDRLAQKACVRFQYKICRSCLLQVALGSLSYSMQNRFDSLDHFPAILLYMWWPISVLGCRLPASRVRLVLSFSLATVWGWLVDHVVQAQEVRTQDCLETKQTMHLFFVFPCIMTYPCRPFLCKKMVVSELLGAWAWDCDCEHEQIQVWVSADS
jgi:hypothetical protein